MIKIPNRVYYLIFLTPVLAQYSYFSGKIDLDVFAILYVILFFIIHKLTEHKSAFKGLVFSYLLYTIVIIIINIAANNLHTTFSDVFLRAGRFCLYFYFATLLFSNYLNYNDALSIYRKVALTASVYIFIQAIIYYSTGIVLPNKIGASSSAMLTSSIGRLKSFYSEPADMAYSIIPFICCSLFGPQYETKDRRFADSIIASLAIIISTSSQGTAIVIILWIIWEIKSIGQHKPSLHIILLLMLFVAIFLGYRSTILEFSLGRLGGLLQGDISSTAWAARSGGFTVYNEQSLLLKVFGNGYGNYFSENIYGYSTWGQFIYFSTLSGSLFMQGILGTIMLVLILLKCFRLGTITQKILVLVFVFLSIGGDPLTGKYLVIYFPLMMCSAGIDEAEGGLL